MRTERRHVRRHEALSAARCLALAATLAGALAACGGVALKPDATLPRPLLQPLATEVGLVLPAELRNYVHKETRFGINWRLELGPGHVHLMHDIFQDTFQHVQELHDVAAAAATPGLKAVFEPLIDQYSFVTEHETGGRYVAATIRYRINLYTPQGEKYDTLTLTGYGSALAKGITNGAPLERATLAAMRDAAAKFLVQFPEQPAGQKLAHNEALVREQATAGTLQIEAVPIEEAEEAPQTPPPAAPPSASPAPPAPPQTPQAPGA